MRLRLGLVGRVLLGATLPTLVSLVALLTMLTSVAALRTAEDAASGSQAVVVAAVDLSRATARSALGQDAGPTGVDVTAAAFLDSARDDPARLRQARDLVAQARAVGGGGPDALATFQDGLDGFLATEQRVVDEQQSDVVGATRRAVVAAAVGLFASLAALAAVGAIVTRSVSLPVARAADVAQEFAGGDLRTRLDEGGVGEIGALQRSLNGMAASLGHARTELAASRSRVLAAGDRTRRQVERDLHDGLQQRLVALSLDLQNLQADVPAGADALAEGVREVAHDLVEAIAELRETARGIHPAVLSDAGLGPALRALARRSALPAEVEVEVGGRFAQEVETSAYYVVSEAVTNAAKHSRAEFVRVTAGLHGDALVVEVADDGVGGAVLDSDGTGLLGLQDRVAAAGGTLDVVSPVGGGTRVRAVFSVGAG